MLTAARLLAALPAHLRRTFLPLARAGFWTLEHDNGYASPSQRAEELYDVEKALERAGFNACRMGARIEVYNARALTLAAPVKFAPVTRKHARAA